jgi:ATP-dependent helicase HepA
MHEGLFVRIAGDRRGVAKLVAAENGMVTLEYFDSAASRPRVEVPRTMVRAVRIYEQTRCYLQNGEEVWQAGRVRQYMDGEYLVDLPDRTSLYVPERELYVRWARPIDDPVEVLVSRAHETPFFHHHRLPFVRALIGQRAAARGLTGLLSSRILLLPHQVEVARRVLEDPVQRYLLADEVGLGKTIEAGIVLRQFLIDHGQGRVLVLVPPHLREQWRSELNAKFAAFDAPGRVVLLGTDEWERAPTTEGVELAVIDEAHHVADLAGSADPSARERFGFYQALARSAPRLLLLSATPALHNEAAFLALLHLLEPEVYRLEDVGLLRARLDARQEVGRFLVSFNETSTPYSLRRGLGRLAELVPDDPYLAELVASLRAVLEADAPDADAQVRRVREIRSHIGDRYRLHRRLLRTRRETVGEGVTAPRQGQRPGTRRPVEDFDGDDGPGVHRHELLEEWREAAFVAWSRAEAAGDGGPAALLPYALVALLDASAAGGSVLAAAVRCRRGEDDGEGLREDLGADAVRALREAPRFEGEDGLLRTLGQTAAADDRDALLVDTVRGFGPRREKGSAVPARKVLVFTTFPTVRRRLAARLAEAFGADAVAGYGAEDDALAADAQVRRFRDDSGCWLLVCDRSGEEGRNLQWTDLLVHFDLPFSPNRVEQRIGRLDRIGRGREVQCRVFLGPYREESAYAAWFTVLDEGFEVFRSSIASLQFFIDGQLPGLVHTLFQGGAQGLLQAIPEVRNGIAAERGRLAEQYALDEIDVLDRGETEYFRDLAAHDAGGEEFRGAFEGWVCDALHLHRSHHAAIPGAVRYQPSRDSLVPYDLLLDRLGPDVIGRPGTFRRGVAAEHSGLTLFRLGEPLVDALEEYVQWDDRGRAFAVWREDARLDPTPGAEWTYFRFDYVVEADTSPAEAVLEAGAWRHATPAALRRRADSLLPPTVETVFVRADGTEAADPLHLRILNRPYKKKDDGGLDHSLTKLRLPALDLVVDRALWPDQCRDARRVGERVLRDRPELGERLAGAATRAGAALEQRVARLRRRADAAGAEDERAVLAAEAELEGRIADALIAGVREPRLRLDSVGFCVLSGRDPFQ